MKFINTYIIGRKRKDIIMRMQKYFVEDKIKAYYVDNIILNEKAISSTNTPYLRQFYINNNIHYNIVNNAFGWGEKMMVLYDMTKIVKTQKINPKDKISVFDLH